MEKFSDLQEKKSSTFVMADGWALWETWNWTFLPGRYVR